MSSPHIRNIVGLGLGLDPDVDFDHPVFRPRNPDYQIGTLAQTRSGAVAMVVETALRKVCVEAGLPPGLMITQDIPDYMRALFCVVVRPACDGALWGPGLKYLLSPMGDDLSDGDKDAIADDRHTAEQAEELRGLILDHPVVPQVTQASEVDASFLRTAPMGAIFESTNGSLLQIVYRGDNIRFHTHPGSEAVEHAATTIVVLRGGHGGKHLFGERAGDNMAIPHDLDNALRIYGGNERLHDLVMRHMLPAREAKVTFVRPEMN